MFDWLASWFTSWVAPIGQPIVDMVHWALHAVTGWAGRIFRAVGGAWDEVYAATGDVFGGIAHFAWRVYRHIEAIVKHDLPLAWRFITGVWNWARRETGKLWNALYAFAKNLLLTLWHAIKDVVGWVVRNIWDPLKAAADKAWHYLVKWGYTAFWYITHPDKLAELIFWQLLRLVQVNAWSAARLLGEFVTALFLHNIRRVALLIEDVLHAVL